jgi:hypothetical protein
MFLSEKAKKNTQNTTKKVTYYVRGAQMLPLRIQNRYLETTLVVTRHTNLAKLLVEREILVPRRYDKVDFPTPNWMRVIQSPPDYVRNRDVITTQNELPIFIAALARSVTIIPLSMNWDDRRARFIPIERLREIAGEPIYFSVLQHPENVDKTRIFSELLDEKVPCLWRPSET